MGSVEALVIQVKSSDGEAKLSDPAIVLVADATTAISEPCSHEFL